MPETPGTKTVAFFSYTRADDRARRGRLSYVRERLEEELRVVSGDHDLEVFQDTDDIALGEDWDAALGRALGESVFFIPMLTPSYFGSEMCLSELARFRRRERELGRNDLILPIYWYRARNLESPTSDAEAFLAGRQWLDWIRFSQNTITPTELDDAILALAEVLDTRLAGMPASGSTEPDGGVAPVAEPSVPIASAPAKDHDRPAWASGGGEDEHGRYLDLACAGVVQRLRWIAPGRFLMGSPEDEEGRDDDEGPQHPVTLTGGFWLADTACTQALWQAVMGGNPSYFKAADRPVENVSWEDTQDFLRRLEGLVPNCVADLPSEAEWEYACRAGTTTAYSFGDEIGPDLARFDSQDGTVPVKSHPANAWGLYEMHGNVWEWCADGFRAYDGESKTDPRSPVGKGAVRARRGGSWGIPAGVLRSACRRADYPGRSRRHQGFRVCLRSGEPSRGRPGGPA